MAKSMSRRCGGWSQHYAQGPIDGLILAATSGEGMTLDMTELERVVTLTRAAIAASQRYIPICLGTIGRRHAEDAGCAG